MRLLRPRGARRGGSAQARNLALLDRQIRIAQYLSPIGGIERQLAPMLLLTLPRLLLRLRLLLHEPREHLELVLRQVVRIRLLAARR